MKTKFKIIGVVAAVALVVTAAYAATSAGSSSDPLVTLSYLTQVFTPQVEEDMEAMVSEKADELTGKFDQAIAQAGTGSSSVFSVVTLSSGQTLVAGLSRL